MNGLRFTRGGMSCADRCTNRRKRAEFERVAGLTTWRSTDDTEAERADKVLAHGLLSDPLETTSYHERSSPSWRRSPVSIGSVRAD